MMNAGSGIEVVLAALCSVAPEAETAALLPNVELREQLDLDSLDFLNFVEALAARTGIVVPECDYPQLLTLDSCSAYVAQHRASQ
jgi:acyl carrier protein